MSRGVIAITCGHLQGIGPEIIAKTLLGHRSRHTILLIGPRAFLSGFRGPSFSRLSLELHEAPERGEVSFSALEEAARLAKKGLVRAIVTAPINKLCWNRAGIPYRGHTDFLATVFNAPDHAMLFHSGRLRLIPFTIHCPLRSIFAELSVEKVSRFLEFTAAAMKKLFKEDFNLYLCGVNPHAGEGGLLGTEEAEILSPAAERVGARVKIRGIFPSDTIFRTALRDPASLVICWYHDQALIPFKLLSFRQGVNLTLGLPVVRTSPVHGTAEEIFGKDIADPSSFRAALKLAEKLL